MSKVIQHLNILHNNPFILTPIIVNFYEVYEGKQAKDMFLAYLILPMVLYEYSKVILKFKKKELRTFINFFKKEELSKNKQEIKKNDKLFGLPGRIEEYKELTNTCLQYAFDTGALQLNQDLSITFLKNDFKIDNSMVEYLKASENLAFLLKKEKITNIYIRLGIKKV
jgi:hypothetical protein